jgi:hypothetical protein
MRFLRSWDLWTDDSCDRWGEKITREEKKPKGTAKRENINLLGTKPITTLYIQNYSELSQCRLPQADNIDLGVNILDILLNLIQ